MTDRNFRRNALKTFGIAAGTAWLSSAMPTHARAAQDTSLLPAGALSLRELTQRLSKAPRRRDFKTVPMILQKPEQWDHEALSELLAYRSGDRQVWDNTELSGPWLNLMRNSLNAQIWSFKHPEFLVVSATHGSAHLALFDQEAWRKYELAKLAGSKAANNVWLGETAEAPSPTDIENPNGAFSAHNNSIHALQQRGVVFLSCHNAIWEVAEKLVGADTNPDKLSHEALAADLTNHVIAGAIVTPGAVGTLPELQRAGFHYAK